MAKSCAHFLQCSFILKEMSFSIQEIQKAFCHGITLKGLIKTMLDNKKAAAAAVLVAIDGAVNGDVVLGFGKYAGESLSEIYAKDSKYMDFLMSCEKPARVVSDLRPDLEAFLESIGSVRPSKKPKN